MNVLAEIETGLFSADLSLDIARSLDPIKAFQYRLSTLIEFIASL